MRTSPRRRRPQALAELPLRAVVRLSGHRAELECGHEVSHDPSLRPPRRKRCPLCPKEN